MGYKSKRFTTNECFVSSESSVLLPGTTLQLDTFTQATSVNPANHTVDLGGTWSGPDATSGKLKIGAVANRLTNPSSDATTFMYQPGILPTANYSVILTVALNSGLSSVRWFVAGHYDSATDSYCYASFNGIGAYDIVEVVNSSGTTRASGTIPSFSTATTYAWELKFNGTAMVLLANGAQMDTAQISTNLSAGSSALCGGGSQARATRFEVISR